MSNSNEETLLDAVNDGLISWESLAREALANMSDDQIGTMDMFLEFFEEEEEEEETCEDCDEVLEDCECEDEYDGQPDEAQEWHDFDPDC